MRTILHIQTRPQDELAAKVIDAQRRLADTHIETVELPLTGADYEALVEKIFSADSVEVW